MKSNLRLDQSVSPSPAAQAPAPLPLASADQGGAATAMNLSPEVGQVVAVGTDLGVSTDAMDSQELESRIINLLPRLKPKTGDTERLANAVLRATERQVVTVNEGGIPDQVAYLVGELGEKKAYQLVAGAVGLPSSENLGAEGLVAYLTDHGAEPSDLFRSVRIVADAKACRINQAGLEDQGRYLIERDGLEPTRELLAEMFAPRRYPAKTHYDLPRTEAVIQTLHRMLDAFSSRSLELQRFTGDPKWNHTENQAYMDANKLYAQMVNAGCVARARTRPEIVEAAKSYQAEEPLATFEQCLLWAYGDAAEAEAESNAAQREDYLSFGRD